MSEENLSLDSVLAGSVTDSMDVAENTLAADSSDNSVAESAAEQSEDVQRAADDMGVIEQPQAETEDEAKADPQQNTANDVEDDTRTVPIKALREERQKRQELQRQLEYFRGQSEAYSKVAPQQQPAQPQADPNDMFFENPSAFVQQQIQSAVMQDRLNRSVEAAKGQYQDYGAMESIFIEQARSDPTLAQKMINHPSPAHYAYQWAKNFNVARQYGGSIESMRERIAAEERAKIEQEMKQRQASEVAAQTPKTQASVRGAGTGKAAEANMGNWDMGAILGTNF